jgi:hypothetical protein
MNARFTEIRKPTGKMSKQKPCWLAEITQMSKQNGKTRKQTDQTRKQMAIICATTDASYATNMTQVIRARF